MKDQRRRSKRRRAIVEQCRPLVEQIQKLTDEVEYLLDQATVERPRRRPSRSRPNRSRPQRKPVAARPPDEARPPDTARQIEAGRIIDMAPRPSGVRGSWSIAVSHDGRTPEITLSGRLTELFYHLASGTDNDGALPDFRTAEQICLAMRAKHEQTVVNLVHRLRKRIAEQGLPKRLIETRNEGGPRYRIRLKGGIPNHLPAVANSPQIRQWSQMAGR